MPGSAPTRGRVTPPPTHSRNRQRRLAPRDTFFGRCCFPVIYFVRNIFSLWPRWRHRARLAETCRLTRAVNNRARTGVLQVCVGFHGPKGVTERGEIDVAEDCGRAGGHHRGGDGDNAIGRGAAERGGV